MFNIRKRRKMNENIDVMLEFHLNEFENGRLSNMDLAIKLGETVKMKHIIFCFYLMFSCAIGQISFFQLFVK